MLEALDNEVVLARNVAVCDDRDGEAHTVIFLTRVMRISIEGGGGLYLLAEVTACALYS